MHTRKEIALCGKLAGVSCFLSVLRWMDEQHCIPECQGCMRVAQDLTSELTNGKASEGVMSVSANSKASEEMMSVLTNGAGEK